MHYNTPTHHRLPLQSGLLSDTTTYEFLRWDPTNSYKLKVANCLQKLEKERIIDRTLHYKLYPENAIPCIYGLPKIHKEGGLLRPIVVTYNTATYPVTIPSPY